MANDARSDAAVALGGGDTSAETGKALSLFGSIAGALAAWSCCILPLILFSVGISGAWIGGLTAFAPYQPIFLGIAVVSLGAGFYFVYRKPKAADCLPGSFCASPKSDRVSKAALWISTILVVVAVAFNYVAPALLGI